MAKPNSVDECIYMWERRNKKEDINEEELNKRWKIICFNFVEKEKKKRNTK